MGSELKIENLNVKVSDKQVLFDLNLTVAVGQIHAIMGPNGSGKSTLASSILKKPGYEIISGSIIVEGTDITAMSPYEIAQQNMFVSGQYPLEIPGVTVIDLLSASSVVEKSEQEIQRIGESLSIPKDLLERGLNVELSGGERKRLDIFQLLVTMPKICVLDELDSGLDVDALEELAAKVYSLSKETSMTVLVITHYARILEILKPDKVHVLRGGKITKSGGFELATELEITGYDN
jgi:Fe-S cluster assembly ATP-binding protein